MENIILEKTEFDKVKGHIYVIINMINNKKYVGQTRTHRLNKNKYRPFGYTGRFNDHINECKTNKSNCCRYLNNSLIKYGFDNFKCELLKVCEISELNEYEKQYIKELNSLFPNGYNLTEGGQSFCKINDIFINTIPKIVTTKKSNKRTEKTKNLISMRLKEYTSKENIKTRLVENARKQHYENKLKIFNNIKIDDVSNFSKYIFIIDNKKNNSKFVRVKINNIQTSFVGKYEDIEVLKDRAIKFLNDLIIRQCDQIAGNP
jgi:group I intron endonuclease